MVARATVTNAVDGKLRKGYVVATGQTIYQGQAVTESSGELTAASGATDRPIGCAVDTEDGTWPAAAGDAVVVALLGSPEVIAVKVGTGGTATAGKFAIYGTAGLTDEAAGGVDVTLGQFIDTGIADDLVGLNMACGGPLLPAG